MIHNTEPKPDIKEIITSTIYSNVIKCSEIHFKCLKLGGIRPNKSRQWLGGSFNCRTKPHEPHIAHFTSFPPRRSCQYYPIVWPRDCWAFTAFIAESGVSRGLLADKTPKCTPIDRFRRDFGTFLGVHLVKRTRYTILQDWVPLAPQITGSSCTIRRMEQSQPMQKKRKKKSYNMQTT